MKKNFSITWMPGDGPPPEINDDKWDKEDQISKRVIVIYDDKLHFASFFHKSSRWSIEGIISSKPIVPKYWAYVLTPDE